jgi:hypothetical protein
MKRTCLIAAIFSLALLAGCSDSTNVEPKATKEDPRLKPMTGGGGASQEKGNAKSAITTP